MASIERSRRDLSIDIAFENPATFKQVVLPLLLVTLRGQNETLLTGFARDTQC
jgi:hypothetical protein